MTHRMPQVALLIWMRSKCVDLWVLASGASGFMQLREITGKRIISCTYEIGKVVT